MPKIEWPDQPNRIRGAWLRHHTSVPEELQALLTSPSPPKMTAQVARAFLRCFYAAGELDRAERDLNAGGEQTDAFAAATVRRRVAKLQQRVGELAHALKE